MTATISNTATQTLIGAGGNTNALVLDATGVVGGVDAGIKSIGASVADSALTITYAVNQPLNFRSATLTSGVPVQLINTSELSLVIPSTATMGTINAQQSRLVVLVLNAAGTLELAVVNIAGGNDLSETGVISTTALSDASDVNDVIYSTTARTGVAYRVVGYVESTQATAGTWATAPSTIQGMGGQALAAMSSIGYGQTWQIVTRSAGVTYWNTTGKPIMVMYKAQCGTGEYFTVQVTTDGVTYVALGTAGNAAGSVEVVGAVSVIVPINEGYRIVIVGAATGNSCIELR